MTVFQSVPARCLKNLELQGRWSEEDLSTTEFSEWYIGCLGKH